MNTPGQRIKEERDAKRWSQQRLADEISRLKGESITRAAVAKWEAGSSKTQKPENFFAAAKALGLNPYWVLDGSGEKYLSPSPYIQAASKGAEFNVSAAPDIRGRVPLISWVQAGVWSEAVDIYEPGYAERWLPFLKSNGDNVFALRVEGDSMTARFGKSYPEGCIIFVDPGQRMPNNGDRIVAKLEGSQKTTFKVFTEDAGRCWLRPLNDSHPPIYDAFTVIGKVIGKWEDG